MRIAVVHALVVLVVAIIVVIAAAAAPASAAPIACGAVLGPGGVFALEADVGPCSGPGPAITLIGPVRLDLRGFDISCTAPAVIGIQITGDSVVVRSTIEGAEAPAEMTGCGGVVVGGNRNRVSDLHMSGVGFFSVTGNQNQIVRDTVTGNGADVPVVAFDVSGDRNLIYGNETSFAGTGFRVNGDFNSLNSNNAHDNSGIGIVVEPGAGNIVVLNKAVGNAEGIEVDGTGTRISSNTALNNATFDLTDSNGPTCDQNSWKDNTFGTADQPCIH